MGFTKLAHRAGETGPKNKAPGVDIVEVRADLRCGGMPLPIVTDRHLLLLPGAQIVAPAEGRPAAEGHVDDERRVAGRGVASSSPSWSDRPER